MPVRTQWPTREELARNERNLLEKLEVELREYETRYEMKSDRVEAEVAAGRMRETFEICQWLIDYDLYIRLKHG